MPRSRPRDTFESGSTGARRRRPASRCSAQAASALRSTTSTWVRGLWDQTNSVVACGDRDAHEFIAVWHREGVVVTAAMKVNIWDIVDYLTAIIEARGPVGPARLADPDVPIGDLVDSPAALRSRAGP